MTRAASPLVYVLDDDPLFNQLIAAILRKFGLRCETFAESKPFLDRVREHVPALCIVDLSVESYQSGFALIKELREEISRTVPILVASGSGDHVTVAHALEQGADDYFLKPVHREVLVSKLSNHLRSEQLENAASGLAPSSKAVLQATLDLDASIVEIDELGLRVVSRSLVTKGAAVPVSGPIIQEIAGRDKPLLVTAASTWIEPEGEAYGAYLEFDASDEALLQNVRSWLVRRSA